MVRTFFTRGRKVPEKTTITAPNIVRWDNGNDPRTFDDLLHLNHAQGLPQFSGYDLALDRNNPDHAKFFKPRRTVPDPILEYPGTEIRMPRHMPSGSQLPACWNEGMDRVICFMEAEGYADSKQIVRAVKRRFPELETHVIPTEAIERRIACLEMQDNDYFVQGMKNAVARAEQSGFTLPPFDPDMYLPEGYVYPGTAEEGQSASRVRMVPRDNTLDPDVQAVAGSIESMIIGESTPVRSNSNHDHGGSGRRVQMGTAKLLSIHIITTLTLYVSAVGQYADPTKQADITNARTLAKTPQPSNYRSATAEHEDLQDGIAPVAAVSTPSNPNPSHAFSNPSSGRRQKHRPQELDMGAVNSGLVAANNATVGASHGNGTISNGSPGFYRSGKENATPGVIGSSVRSEEQGESTHKTGREGSSLGSRDRAKGKVQGRSSDA